MADRELVSKSEYARHRGVSPAMVSHWTNAARIVIVDGRVDLAASDAALAATLDPAKGGRGGKSNRTVVAAVSAPGSEAAAPADSGQPAAGSYTAVRTVRETFRAKTDELEYLERAGKLVERRAYDKALSDGLGPCLSALDSLSARLGPGLAAESDVRKVQNMIDDAVTQIRQDVAATLRRMIDGTGATQ